jgi:hypothetical protein
MATAPTSRKLNLTRDQLAQFLTDQQQIRQFELLFSVVDELQVITGTDFEYQADTAAATANEALAQLSALAQDTAVEDAVLNAKVQQALDAIPGLAQALELMALAPRQELGTIASQNSDNVNITGGLISGLDAPLPVASGGIGVTTAAANRVFSGPTSGLAAPPSFRSLVVSDIPALTSGTSILYGNGTGGFSNVTIGTGVSFAAGTLSATGTGGTVTSVTGTSPVVSSGGTTPAISLATGYGDTQNPYASKTANYFLAAPNGSAGAPTFRAMVAADVPALSYVSSVSATAPITSSGGLTPTIGVTSAALTKTDDTNVTMTLGGTPASALLAAASLTLGWTGQLAISRGGTGQSSFTANYVHYGSFSTSSNLQFDGTNLGIGGAPTYSVDIKSTTANGALRVYSNASSTTPAMYVAGSGTVNGVGGTPNGNGLMIMYRDTGNLRSLSAAGSLNANGADYAEYMTKCSDFVLQKGDICGIDSNGLLTNKFSDAVSFVVKTTNPSYVGGDDWFTEPSPLAPILEEGATDERKLEHASQFAEYETLLAAWKQRGEVARSKVDRIAFCGQVPVNVQGAKPGQFIIPVNNNGLIGGESIDNPSFEQYRSAIGKVIAIESDGRAKIIVKIS